MSTAELIAVITAIVAILFAALLAAAETAITRMSSSRAATLEEEGRTRAATLRQVIDNRETALSSVLLVLLSCDLGAASLLSVVAYHRWGANGAVIGFLATLAVVFVFAEAIPKAIALRDPDRTALRLAPLVRLLGAIPPLRWLAAGVFAAAGTGTGQEESVTDVTEEELLALASEAAASESIEQEEHELIASIISFGDTIAREVMVPRPDMVTVDAEATIVEALDLSIDKGFSRLPVTGESIDDIAGIVHVKDLVQAERSGRGPDPLAELSRSPMCIPETKRVSELMREMQAEQTHQAIVIDEYGGTAGLVTLEDLIEELVGEIVDEFDVEMPMIERIDDRQFRVNGRVPIAELETAIGADLPEGDWDTVGGLIFNSLGHVPDTGEPLEVEGHRFTVERVINRRIARVRLDIAEPVTANDANGEAD